MRNEKITPNMSPVELIMTMSEGNPGAMRILMNMILDLNNLPKILLCDSLDIRGSKLYMLFNDCCNNDNVKFNRTLMMLNSGVFTLDEIHNNLNLTRAIPFIDDNIKIDGITDTEENFGPGNKMWKEYCEKNKKSFLERLNKILENIPPHNTKKK